MTQDIVNGLEATINKISDLAILGMDVKVVEQTTHLVIPEKYKHIDLTGIIEKAQMDPNRKLGTVFLTDLDSFIAYAEAQKIHGRGYIYCDVEKRTLTAIFNDHGDNDAPGWRDFRAVYQAELSRELDNWLRNNKQPKEQEDFAVFLEDNIADVVEPSGDVLLAIALTLQAKTEINFNSSKRLDNGQVQLTYTENIDARAAEVSPRRRQGEVLVRAGPARKRDRGCVQVLHRPGQGQQL